MTSRIVKIFLATLFVASLSFGADDDVKENDEFLEANICDVDYGLCMTNCDEKEDETQRESCYDSCDKKYDECMQDKEPKDKQE